MATNVTMPKLGLTMETGKIVEWKAAEGGDVKEGDILLIVETEKITYEVESPATGLLHIIVAAEEEVPVAELIGVIAADKAELDSLPAGGAPASAARRNSPEADAQGSGARAHPRALTRARAPGPPRSGPRALPVAAPRDGPPPHGPTTHR